MMRFLSRVIPALALLALAAPAAAQNVNLGVNAQVLASCRVTTANPAINIAWDLFDNTTASASAAINVRCTKNLTISVAANGGLNGAAGGFLRSVNGPEQIGYALSLSSGGPELVVGAQTGTGLATAGRQTDVPVTLHAALDTAAGGAAGPAAGNYADTVILTFTAL